ncbi:CBS domain-containing protein [Streptomyces sp. YIM S03343]
MVRDVREIMTDAPSAVDARGRPDRRRVSVAEAISREPVTVHVDEDISHAARRMREPGTGAAPQGRSPREKR